MSDHGLPFDDADPDDAWDATDTVEAQVAVIVLRILLFVEHADDYERGRRSFAELADRANRIAHDLAYIRARILVRDLGD